MLVWVFISAFNSIPLLLSLEVTSQSTPDCVLHQLIFMSATETWLNRTYDFQGLSRRDEIVQSQNAATKRTVFIPISATAERQLTVTADSNNQT